MNTTIKIRTDMDMGPTVLGRDARGNTVRLPDLAPTVSPNTVSVTWLPNDNKALQWPALEAPQGPPIRYELVKRSDELQSLRDDNAKLENDLAYERYRVRQLELLGAAKQPLSFAWHDQPDVAAPPPKGPPPIPARALRPWAGHPMPWLTE